MCILLADPTCNCCLPQMHIERMASVNSCFHLPKILFSSLQLKRSILHKDEHKKMRNIRNCETYYVSYIIQKVSITRKCHNHRLQTNTRQPVDLTEHSHITITVKQQALFFSKMIAKLEREPRTAPQNNDPITKTYIWWEQQQTINKQNENHRPRTKQCLVS